jgi:hypothetical protein
MASAEIDDTACNVAANVCDEQVQILPLSPATYENRYESHGSITTSEAPDAAIAKLLSAMGGLLAYSSGKVVMYAATYQIPPISLREKHFVGPMSVTTRTSARDRVNTVKGVYVSELNQWQPSDFPLITPDRWLDDGDTVMVGEQALEVIHCPGHTPGHVVFFHLGERLAFVGDVLFAGSIGRTDFPRGNHADLIEAIKSRLFPLGDDIAFVPGHGPMSTFGEERLHNPFVRD